MQDTGVIVTQEEMRQLLEDRVIRAWLSSVECLHYPSSPSEFGIPLPPEAPSLPLHAETPAGEQFLQVAAMRQP